MKVTKTLALDHLGTGIRACMVGSPRDTSIARTRPQFWNCCSALSAAPCRPLLLTLRSKVSHRRSWAP